MRAWARARGGAGITTAVALVAACGLLAGTTGPVVAQCYTDWDLARATELALSSDDAEATQGVARLRKYRFLVDFDMLVLAYMKAGDAARRERLAEEYKELTGTPIERWRSRHRLVF